ncbi:hypothetical protein [Leifsonia virtsii]|uniref:Uncharacterized protein n=1 Tax=Leifsonia virtsii TaxID=3035915 RepID=A0ABT8J153_9MICO|nr:hypothetical protein [Leifsonia virtsii]MDN4598823.1 hypothetical protein [Leifsonia virtsii]
MTMQPLPQPGPTLVHVGNVTANDAWIVTPAGTWPIADVNVTTVDQTNTTTHTPAWAIVMVVVFIWFFLLSLLFLLAREVRVGGFVAIHISARNGQTYTEQVPVYSAQQRADVFARAGYLQALIGHARAIRG